jgi:hypothetical protein
MSIGRRGPAGAAQGGQCGGGDLDTRRLPLSFAVAALAAERQAVRNGLETVTRAA